jgi:hypothetical protein
VDPNALLSPTILVPVAVVLVLVVGVIIGVVRISASRRGGGAVAKWAHGAYSLWTGGEDCATWAPERAQKAFREWYNASSGGQAQNVIDGLRRGQTGNPAWDKVRALDLCRIALAAGYVDADQCRQRSAAIGKELQAAFPSWDALAQAFEAGMQAWQRSRGVTDSAQLGKVQHNLPKLRAEIWPGIAYGTVLTEE